MSILSRLKRFHKQKYYCTFIRNIDGQAVSNICGYIVGYTEDFLLIQETDDFLLKGLKIIPLDSVSKIRHNRNDQYYDQIMRWEKIWDQIDFIHKVDLTNWSAIFNSIQNLGFNVIIENEHKGEGTFDIGPIIKVTEKYVRIWYFDAQGVFRKNTTKFKWKDITLVTFNDRYVNVFSKYVMQDR